MVRPKAIYDSADEIPESIENFRDLFVEKNGKFELTLEGVQTAANVSRLEVSLRKERDDHKATKGKLEVWGDLDHDDVLEKLDRIPTLEAAAEGKLDDAKIEELASKRAEAIATAKMSPLQRELAKAQKERDDFYAKVTEYQGKETRRTIHDSTRKALLKSKAIPEAQEDALFQAERVFEITEDGTVQTREGVGVTPGLDPESWLAEIADRKPHWWPTSQGGGARGSNAGGGGIRNNPFTNENWNVTAQGQYIRAHGMEKARQAAEAAGTTLGGARPAPKK